MSDRSRRAGHFGDHASRVGWDKPKAHPNVAAIVLAMRDVGPRCAWPNLLDAALGMSRTAKKPRPAGGTRPGVRTP